MPKENSKIGRPLTDATIPPWPELFRYEHGQAKLAAKLGVSQTTIGKWARGVHRIPELARRELIKLCKKHGIKDNAKIFELSDE
jgi:hypothetical protein